MKIKCTIIITLIATAAIVTFLLVYHASHSTDEMVRRRAVIAYYHFMRCSAERREAARYLLDNMPYHYGYARQLSMLLYVQHLTVPLLLEPYIIRLL